MKNKPLEVVFDANPLVKGNKSGIGYFAERLITALSESFPNELRLHGYYFNFGKKYGDENLPKAKNLEYTSLDFLPERVVNVSKRAGINIPLNYIYRGPVDIALFPNFVSLPTKKKTYTVVVVHDLAFVDRPEFVSTRNGIFLRKVVPQSIKKADLVVTISEFTKRRIHEVYKTPLEKIYVMYIPPVQKVTQDKRILKRYGLNKYLLFVGTIEPRKNIETLLREYSRLEDSITQNVPLVLAGNKGWKDSEIILLIDELRAKGKDVILTGYISDAEKSALYSNATIVIQPSHYEGFGMPVLEAMNYGRPVVCSDIEVLHEVAAESARYFDKEIPGSLADLLTELLKSEPKLKELSKRSQKRVTEFPTWQSIAKDFYSYVSTRMKNDY